LQAATITVTTSAKSVANRDRDAIDDVMRFITLLRLPEVKVRRGLCLCGRDR
jgi:hypothetical protein